MRLHDFHRSSAAYRVRIALNLKGLAYDPLAWDLRGGAHRSATYTDVNPQGLVPALETGGAVISQSLAIIEYLEETAPNPPLLPRDALGRARVRSLALIMACDIHPLNNLRVLQQLETLGVGEPDRNAWARRWIGEGLAAVEKRLADGPVGRFCHGDTPTLADVCLTPQLYSARRFEVDVAPYPTVLRATEAAEQLSAFRAAHPEQHAPAA